MSEPAATPQSNGASASIALKVFSHAPQSDVPICVKCADRYKTCCQRAEVVITDGDIQRIERHSGRREFWERRHPTNLQYLDQDDDPLWLRATLESDGSRRVLRRRENGDCTFLTEAGCSLSMETRPLVCRLYPFSYTQAGLDGVNADYCPKELIPPGRTIVELLEMKLPDARRWHRDLYDELSSQLKRRDNTSPQPQRSIA